MNRRKFLRFAAVAPVVLPMVTEASAAHIYIGVDWASEADRLGVAYMRSTVDGWAQISGENLLALSRHPDFFKLNTLLSDRCSSVMARNHKPLLNQS